MSNESIDIEIHENGSRTVRRNLGDIGAAAETSARQIDVLKAALGGIAIGTAVREVIKLADAYTTLTNKLAAAGVELWALSTVQDALLKIANDTRASLDATSAVYSRLALSTKELGLSYQDILDLSKSLNQALIIGGSTGHEAAAGMLQLSQAIASNRLGGDELRSVLEQLPVVADVIAKHMKVTRGELRELGTQGKLTAKDIVLAFREAAADLNDRFNKTVPTVTQSFTVLRNQIEALIGKLNEQYGVTAAISRAILFLSDNIEIIAKVVGVLVAVLAVLGSAALIAKVVNGLLSIAAAALANPYVALAVALAAVVAAFYLFGDSMDIGIDKVTSVNDLFRALGAQITDAFTVGWQVTKDFFTNLGQLSEGVLVELDQLTGGVFSNMWNTIAGFYSDLDFTIAGVLQGIARTFDLYMNTYMGVINVMIKVLSDFSLILAEAFTGAAAGVVATWDNVSTEVSQTFVSLWNGIATWGDRVITLVGGYIPNSVKQFFADAYNWVIDLFNRLAGKLLEIINKIREYLGKEALSLGKAISDEWSAGEAGRADVLKQFQDYGVDLSKAFNKGMNANGNPIEDWVKKTFKQAAEIGANRTINNQLNAGSRTPADLTKRGPDLTKTNNKDNSKQVESLRKQYLDLVKRIDPAAKATAEWEKEQTLLNKALKAGAITQIEYQYAQEKTNQHLRDSVDETSKAANDFRDMLLAMKAVSDKLGGFDKEAMVRQISQKYPDLFFGTDQEIRNKATEYQETLNRINQLQQQGLIAETQANQMRAMQSAKVKQDIQAAYIEAANFRLKTGAGTWADEWLVALSRVTQGFTTFAAGAADVIGQFNNTMVDGIANSVGRAIVYSEDLGTALYDVARGALAELISGFVKLGIQWLINSVISQSISTTTQAAAVASGTAAAASLAAAWAPAAAAASLASFGANSAPAMAGITATYSLTEALSVLSGLGFEKGGFTGMFGKKEIAGVVHGQEYVMNAAATKRIGVPTLDALQTGKMDPSSVGGSIDKQSSSSRKGSRPLSVTIQNYGSNKDFEVKQLSEDDVRIIARDEGRKAVYQHAPSAIAGDIGNPNSKTSRAIQRNTTTQRRRSS